MSQQTNLLKAQKKGSHLRVERGYHPSNPSTAKIQKISQNWVHYGQKLRLIRNSRTPHNHPVPLVIISGVSSAVTCGSIPQLVPDSETMKVLNYWLLNVKIQSLVVYHDHYKLYHWVVEFHSLKDDPTTTPQDGPLTVINGVYKGLTPLITGRGPTLQMIRFSDPNLMTKFESRQPQPFGKKRFSSSKGYIKNCQGLFVVRSRALKSFLLPLRCHGPMSIYCLVY